MVLNQKTVRGASVLVEGRALLRQYVAQGLRVPKVTITGEWLMNGFSFDFEKDEDAYLPFGNKYVSAGPKKAKVEPTEGSVLTIYTVAEGETLAPNATLAKVNLLAPDTQEQEAEPDDAE
jgi:hypothetical protein